MLTVPRAASLPWVTMCGSLKMSSVCVNVSLLKLLACKDTASVVCDAVDAADGRERLFVGRANFQRAIGFAQSESGQDVLIAIKAMGIDRDRLLACHSSGDITGDDFDICCL